MTATPAGAGAGPSPEALRRARLASVVGSSLEWYDYFLFGTASALVFGDLFFPGEDPLISTLSAFAVFGVGFVARPLGGLVLGRLGDRIGRRYTLLVTLAIMGTATTLVGALPTAGQAGIVAPVLLVVLRLVQGFGVGGEWGGAALLAVEYAPPERRGRWGSLPQMGTGVGAVLSSGVFALVSLLPAAQFEAWGWRIPFLLSIVLVAVGAWIRRRVEETPAFRELQDTGGVPERPVVETFTRHGRMVALAAAIRLSENTYGYVVLTFALTLATRSGEIPRSTVLLGVVIATLLGCGLYYLAGGLSDRVGRRPVYLGGALFGVVFAFPFLVMLDSGVVAWVWLGLLLGWGVAAGSNYALQPAWFTELFGTRVRYTGISAGYQIGTLISGFAPLIATAVLAAAGGAVWGVAIFLAAMSAISAAVAWVAPDPYRDGLRAAPASPVSAGRPG